MKYIRFITIFISILACASCNSNVYDVVIYGGTSAGVMAAVQAAKDGKTVVLIEPLDRIGGLTTGGLGQTDAGIEESIGGLALEFYKKVGKEYDKDISWTFEPKVALKVFEDYLKAYNIPVYKNEYIDLDDGVVMQGREIRQIKMESGKIFKGKVFLDTSYEGDLMALAGVSYTVGRESNSEFGETRNGIFKHNKALNEMPYGVSPYIVPGDPSSGLLPRINPTAGGENGDGDKKIQAYCFRMCLTNDPDNRIMIEKPDGYDPLEYELLLRALELGMPKDRCFKLSPMPNKKTDSNNHYGISTDLNGGNWDYAEGDHKLRAEIKKRHEIYQKGLVWTIQNHPRVPKEVKDYYKDYGLPKDEFIENNHWPQQLYVRESRRMRGQKVITEHDVLKKYVSAESIGLGSYAMDSHNTQYFVNEDGFANTEGGFYYHLDEPYPISYKAITPKKEECTNLLVPVCLSATHAAYGSIRMEPVFMILGQSAAIAASIAIDNSTSVQDVDYMLLRDQLLKVGQKL